MEHRIWDPFVRVFHWSLVTLFAANALFTNPESKLHRWVGYAVVVLVLLRVLWGLVGTRHARFADFPPSVSGAARQMADVLRGRKRIHLGHTPLGAWMIYNLLLSMLGLGLTGWLMTTNTFWGVEWVEEAHESIVAWAELSVVVHVAAVVWESLRTGVNLPRAMVTGRKVLPHGADTEGTQEG